MKASKILLIFIALIFFVNTKSNAQKILSEHEMVYIEEAKTELERALTDPTLSESERLKMIERSAKTFKDYGQPSAFPSGDLPLKEMMDNNYEQCKNQIIELTDLSMDLRNKTLEQKRKLINAIQIEVVEEQIELLIPGKAPFQLSKDAVNKVVGVDIAEGVNSGKRGDAQSLAASFRRLSETNKLVKNINVAIFYEKQTLRKLDVDRKQVKRLETKLRDRYKYGESSTRVQSGYEGALLRTPGNSTSIEVAEGLEEEELSDKKPISGNELYKKLLGSWRYVDVATGEFDDWYDWTFDNDGTCYQRGMSLNSKNKWGITEYNYLRMENYEGHIITYKILFEGEKMFFERYKGYYYYVRK